MKTEIIKLYQENIEKNKLIQAANIIRNGGLVAFPTETVYGLGANTFNSNAVKKIFMAKGRPSGKPLIILVSNIRQINNLILEFPPIARKLINKFWPGPLTLIFKKSSIVPDDVTAGFNTVAIRMPSHPIALALIGESGLPIAAPSANSSGKPSPTSASHVVEDLSGKIDLIIDGGITNIGLESTVLDITSGLPMILRPGAITKEQLEEELGEVKLNFSGIPPQDVTGVPAEGCFKGSTNSPEIKYKHYSPKANLIIVEGEQNNVTAKINEMANNYKKKGMNVGILATEQTKNNYDGLNVISMGDRNKPYTIASGLFNCFRELDNRGLEVILAETINDKGIGLTIMNRMIEAARYNIIKV